jgi:signal transduction histidine kinase
MAAEVFHFTVDNQLLSELGERLVAKNYIALAELIKNAYDADAKSVTVALNTAAPGGGEIVITDAGQGMTAAEVQRYWMRVATDHKVREPRTSKYGRYKSGSKGIGRFACRRLAQSLFFTSVAKVPGEGFEVTTMTFKWKTLKAGKDLAREPFEAEITRVSKARPGLTLHLKGLSEHWTQRDFNVLRRSLVDVSIARPEQRKGYEPDPGFTVELTSDTFVTSDTLLSEQYLNAGWGRLKASVASNGLVRLDLSSKDSSQKSFTLPKEFKRCQGVEVDIAWIPGGALGKEYWRDPKVMTDTVRRQIGETQGGVKVYSDGFRVYPYGESGTDWLDISRKLARRVGGVDAMFRGIATKLGVDSSRALLDHPKETTLLGKVIISSSSDQFIIKMDREGFVENAAYLELKQFVQLALEWMTVQYVSYKQHISEARLKEEGRELPATEGSPGGMGTDGAGSPQAALNAAIAVVEKAGQKGIDAVPGRGKTLASAVNVIRRSADVMDARLAKLQILASTGPVVFAFAHEIKSLIARLATHANELSAIAKTVEGKERKRLSRLVDDLLDTRTRLDHEVELFGTFSRSLAEDVPARHSVGSVTAEVAAGFSFLAESFNITIDQSGIAAKAKTSPMRSAEIYSVLVNLISNALKSCMAGGGKMIGVTAEREDRGLVVRVRDTGVGLSDDHWERAFEALVSDPEDKIYRRLDKVIQDDDLRTLGRGSGLGLSIVRDIVTAKGGSVHFVKPRPPWRACVEVVLP